MIVTILLVSIFAPFAYAVGWLALILALVLYQPLRFSCKLVRAAVYVGEPVLRSIVATM